MFKSVIKLNDRTGEKNLYIVPSTGLEEKFVSWFSGEYMVQKETINGRMSLWFPIGNDPSDLEQNMQRAYEEFKKRFRYVEIPSVTGLTLLAAKDELRTQNMTWGIEREIESHDHPKGTVISQKPPAGAGVSITDSVIYLTVSKGPGPKKT
jgi:hypothetical protein